MALALSLCAQPNPGPSSTGQPPPNVLLGGRIVPRPLTVLHLVCVLFQRGSGACLALLPLPPTGTAPGITAPTPTARSTSPVLRHHTPCATRLGRRRREHPCRPHCPPARSRIQRLTRGPQRQRRPVARHPSYEARGPQTPKCARAPRPLPHARCPRPAPASPEKPPTFAPHHHHRHRRLRHRHRPPPAPRRAQAALLSAPWLPMGAAGPARPHLRPPQHS